MDIKFIIIIILAVLVIGFLLWMLLSTGSGFNAGGLRKSSQDSLRNLVASQRELSRDERRANKSQNLTFAAAAQGEVDRKSSESSSRVTLAKRLQYGRWPINEKQFRIIQIFSAIVFGGSMYASGSIPYTVLALLVSPMLIDGLLERTVNKRFNAFDVDYPVMLLSYVGLLKTGMSTIPALEAAAKGLSPDSLVRLETELLIERLRLGLTEDQAISAFGEDIPHPEIELFVQSLLLSKKVGGKLSDTLERLAKQVRKRQQFRSKAVGAVAMERGSIYVIMLIMSSLLVFIYFKNPDLIKPAFTHKLGKIIFDGGVTAVVLGFLLSKKVSNIKI